MPDDFVTVMRGAIVREAYNNIKEEYTKIAEYPGSETSLDYINLLISISEKVGYSLSIIKAQMEDAGVNDINEFL